MRSLLRWTALFAVAIVAVAVLTPEHAIAGGQALLNPGASSLIVGPALLGALGPLSMIGRTREVDLDRPDVNLRSKSREANDLRAKAQALLAEIADTSKPMTTEQFKAKKDECDALNLRANMLSEFDGESEIRRQGGDEDVERLTHRAEDGPENDTREDRLTRRTRGNVMEAKIADFAHRAKQKFGDVRSFLDIAVAGNPRIRPTQAQAEMIREAGELTRAIVGTTGDISGGEYLLPLTQVASVFSLSNVQQGILQRARSYNVPGRTLRIPYLIQDDSAASDTLNRPMAGNIANVTIVGEGSTKPPRPPKFGQRLITVYKYAAITQVSDELLADDFTGELPSEFVNAVGQQALNAVNEDITIDGSGSGEPDGALYAGAAWNIAVTRNTSSTIKPDDLFGMYARHTHGPGSVWLASRRTVQALFAMSLTSASLVTFLRDLNGVPEMRILGYPVILTDLLPTLGSASDIALVNPDFYAFALRQALTVEMDRSIGFIEDLTTYRFVVRAGGIPLNPDKYAYKYSGTQGVDEHSPFVYLDA